MHCTKRLTEDILWIGGNDRRLALFENAIPIPRGVSYNAYLVRDEKTVLIDTVDKSVSGVFFENLAHALEGRTLDYLVINHMEPDHSATIDELILRYPNVKLVTNAKVAVMLKQFFTFDVDARVELVKEGDTLSTGRHTLTFVMAPMVHWPEVMMTYDTTDKILFSADAFGTFGALSGSIYADEVHFEQEWLTDARRYYTNIVGKYGTQVTAILNKAANLDIALLCPLHGPVWRKNIDWYVDKYLHWASYTPEENGVLIAYASVYGHTENMAEVLANALSARGVEHIAMYDTSATHPTDILAEAFRYSHLVFASSTYNAGIFITMETLLHDLAAHNLQNRTVAVMENGTWAATSGKLMRGILDGMKNMTVLENTVSIKSALKEDDLPNVEALADAIAASLKEASGIPVAANAAKVDNKAMFALSYGLFVLSAKDGEKDNACIINTVTQITSTPNRISIAVNKQNYTHDMIKKTGVFNVSVLTESVPFTLFQRFGFASGRDTDKLAGFSGIARSANGVLYITECSNAFLSAKVVDSFDYGTHTLFIADVTEGEKLSADASITYAYYFANTKPAPKPQEKKVKGFVCKICGYVYEGDTLPADFVCPLCKHGAEDFEPLP